MIKETAQKENKMRGKSGTPLIAASIFLAGLVIAAAVLVKDSVALPFGSSPKEEVLGTGAAESGTSGDQTEGRITVADSGSPSMGAADAPVVIYEFSDFTCPYCAAASGSREDVITSLQSRDPSWEAPFPAIVKKYIESGKVRLIFKIIPGHGQPALKAGVAALCAGDQDKFWEYHDLLFANQADWYGESTDEESLTRDFEAFAEELDLDKKQFKECVESDTYSSDIMQNYSDSKDLFEQLKDAGQMPENQAGLGTPTYIINGRYLAGAQSFAKFEELIEKELAE